MKNRGMDTGLLNESVLLRSPEKIEPFSMRNKFSGFERTTSKDAPARLNDRMPWVTNGVTFPHGTEFRGRYKGYTYFAKVDNGALILNGKTFYSPSAAAMTITRNPVDGWVFWDCKEPERPYWVNIREIRK